MITTVPEAEPIGPKKLLDCLVIAPDRKHPGRLARP